MPDTTHSAVVQISHRQFTSTIRGDRHALRIVERAVPRSGWNRGDRPAELVVTTIRVASAITALERHGYEVAEAPA